MIIRTPRFPGTSWRIILPLCLLLALATLPGHARADYDTIWSDGFDDGDDTGWSNGRETGTWSATVISGEGEYIYEINTTSSARASRQYVQDDLPDSFRYDFDFYIGTTDAGYGARVGVYENSTDYWLITYRATGTAIEVGGMDAGVSAFWQTIVATADPDMQVGSWYHGRFNKTNTTNIDIYLAEGRGNTTNMIFQGSLDHAVFDLPEGNPYFEYQYIDGYIDDFNVSNFTAGGGPPPPPPSNEQPYMIEYSLHNLTTFAEDGINHIIGPDIDANNDGVYNEYLFVTDATGTGLDPELVYHDPTTGTNTVLMTAGGNKRALYVELRDYDHDGDNDIIFGFSSASGQGRLWILEINESLDIQNQTNVVTGDATCTHVKSRAWEDWDNDGVDEFFTCWCACGKCGSVDGDYVSGLTWNTDVDNPAAAEGALGYDWSGDGTDDLFYGWGYSSGGATDIYIHKGQMDSSNNLYNNPAINHTDIYNEIGIGDGVGDLDGDGNMEFVINGDYYGEDKFDIYAFEFDTDGNITESYQLARRIDANRMVYSGVVRDDDGDGHDSYIVFFSNDYELEGYRYDVNGSHTVTATKIAGDGSYGQDFHVNQFYHGLEFSNTHPMGICTHLDATANGVAVIVNHTRPFLTPIAPSASQDLNLTFTCFDANNATMTAYYEIYSNGSMTYSGTQAVTNATETTVTIPNTATVVGDVYGLVLCDDGMINSTNHTTLTREVMGLLESIDHDYNALVYETTTQTINVTFSAPASNNIDDINATLYYNGSALGYDSKTTSGDDYSFSKTINISFIEVNATGVTFYWNYTVYESTGTNTTADTANQTQTVMWAYFPVSIEASDDEVTEGTNVTFSVNVSDYGDANFTVTVWFDGSEYATELSGGLYEVELSTTGASSTSYYNGSVTTTWNGDTAIRNTTSGSLVVFNIILTNCSADSESQEETLHFYIKDEDTDAALTGDLDIAFDVWVVATSKANFSFEFTGQNNYSVCIFPTWAEYYTDAMAEYSATGYSSRTYYLAEAEISNTSQDIDLYLKDNETTDLITMQVYNALGIPEEDVYINIARYDVGTNTYSTVAIVQTNFDGKAFAYLTKNTIWYRFTLIQDGVILEQYSPTIITEDTLTFRLSQTALGEYFDYHGNIAVNCSWPNNTTTCTVTDTSGLMETTELDVKRWTSLGYIDVCSSSDTGSSVTLVCPMGTLDGKIFFYRLDATFAETEDTLESGFRDHRTGTPVYGDLGVLVSLMIMLVMIFIGIQYRWEISITLSAVAITLSWAGGLLFVTMTSVVAFFVVAAVVIYKTRSR